MLLKMNKVFLIGCLIGIIIFIFLYGVNVLDVSYDDWLLSQSGDLTCEYVGWLFFRESAWSFPIGNMDGLMHPYETSVIYNDSIPLLAIFFKIFEAFLPETFQYWGIWGILCLMLQGGISAVILKKVTKNSLISCIGSVVFCISTIMLKRLYGHSALGGHFVILLAILLWLYKDRLNTPLKKISAWSGIGLLCVLVNMYFFPMIFVIMFFSHLYEFMSDKVNTKNFIVMLIMPVLITAFFWWFFGGFNVGAVDFAVDGKNSDFGLFSANLNSFINPKSADEITSKYLKPIEHYRKGEYEGYAYLGLGVILLLIINFGVFLTRINKNNKNNKNNNSMNIKEKLKAITKNKKIEISFEKGKFFEKIKRILHSEATYIILCSISLVILSALPQITFFSSVLLDLKLPKVFFRVFDIFFSNGRFLWPVWYIIVIYAIYLTSKNYKNIVAVGITIICILIQISDFGVYLTGERVRGDWEYVSPLTSVAWEELADTKKDIFLMERFINDGARGEGWHEFEYEIFAIENGLTVNDTYTSKKNGAGIDALKNKEWEKLLANSPDKNKIYIFNEIPKNIVLREILNVYRINGRIVGCVDEIKNLDSEATKIVLENFEKYNLGTSIYLDSVRGSEEPIILGLNNREIDGTWTSDENMLLDLFIPDVENDLMLYMNVVSVRPNVSAKLIVNGTLEYNIDLKSLGMKEFRIPNDLVTDNAVTLTVVTEGAESPYNLGESNDLRKLGFKIDEIKISEIAN